MGRMIGLFNVQNLMRRLSLDFSDLFQSGTGFDQITGEFTFKQGQAYTDNLTIEAPAARIQVQGRTGLKERDYEQRVTVTPRFGGALPIAGVLAGGPAVGAAVLLAERLLQKGIEQATPLPLYVDRFLGSPGDGISGRTATAPRRKGRRVTNKVSRRISDMPIIAAIQMVSGPSVAENLAAAADLLAQAAGRGAQLAVLPENFALMGQRESDKLAVREVEAQGPIQDFLAEQAARHRLWLVGGTIPSANDGDDARVRAACLLFDDQGRQAARYDKVHLFDVQVVGSAERYAESATIEPGDSLCGR